MPRAEEDDELVMSLVEATRQTPASERPQLLEALCSDARLRDEVLLRIEWEERMGRFLLDPLFERELPGDPFLPGEVLADRFRIVRKVGYGGMGVVFEAFDQKLERRVALKCARPGFLNRLSPEARAAREVSHYNVCKVYELHVASTSQGDVDFLVMEFIEGRTLSDRLAQDGPVPESEAREIARQLCAGLAQAHRQGVVHGDLKCSNIILADSPQGGVRAVITDFGLAKLKQGEGAHSMSGRGGTFDYMAPELLLGQRATVASDLYALGVLLHTMLTGDAPERAAPEPAESTTVPVSLASTQTVGYGIAVPARRRKLGRLPSHWSRAVARCLEPRPEDRYGSAEELPAALARRLPRLLWAGVAAVLLVAAVLAWAQWGRPSAGPPVRLAILPFEAEGDARATAAGIALDIAERLAGARRNFAVISPRESEANFVTDPARAGRVFRASHVLHARMRNTGTAVAVEASVLDLASGRSIGQVRGSYPPGDPAAIAKAILATITRTFQLRAAIPSETVAAAAYAPYVQGLELLRKDALGNAERVIALFETALQADPRSALIHAGLAEAQAKRYERGDGPQWLDRAGATAAAARSINSDSVPVLLIAGYLDQLHGDYEQAIRNYGRALERESGNPEAWRRLANLYESSNRIEEAATTYRRAIDAQPGFYRQYIAFGNFYYTRGKFRDAEEQYRRVLQLAPGLPIGHMNLGVALMQQGRFAEAEGAFLEALALRKTPLALLNLGGLYYALERYQDAARYFQESLASGSPTAMLYRDLGDVWRHLGRPADAADAYRKGLAVAEADVARNPRQAFARVYLALIAAFLGDSARARFELAQAVALEPDNPSVLREAVIACEVLGDRDRALELLERAPGSLLAELSRQPDVKSLHQDPRFQNLLRSKPAL